MRYLRVPRYYLEDHHTSKQVNKTLSCTDDKRFKRSLLPPLSPLHPLRAQRLLLSSCLSALAWRSTGCSPTCTPQSCCSAPSTPGEKKKIQTAAFSVDSLQHLLFVIMRNNSATHCYFKKLASSTSIYKNGNTPTFRFLNEKCKYLSHKQT